MFHTESLLNQIRMASDTVTVDVQGIPIEVFPGVFRPTTESRLLAEHIRTCPDERILDMTTGSGVAAVIAGLQGASGIAVDINPQAVANAQANFKKLDLPIEAIQSNMFENIPPEQFDLILCNPPYFEGHPKDILEYAIIGGRDYLWQLFSGLERYVSQTGKLLLTYAEWAGDMAFLEHTMQQFGYAGEIIGRKASDDGKRWYRLYEVRKEGKRLCV